uniref:Outer capsid protein VP5 n=1 Tax=Skunk River virus TaxID=2488682 RepID=A0A3Q8RTP3_9REOV|nr:VP5 [Skunk River virus]
MGKFTNFLSRVGSGINKVASSKTTQNILGALGSAANKFVESEIGQRTITGFVEGSVLSATTGEAFGDSIRKSVILNVAGISNEVPDPLNKVEHELIDSVNCLRNDKRADELKKKYEEAMHDIYDEERTIKQYMEKTVATADREEEQINVLDAAIKVLSKAVNNERDKLSEVEQALKKEEAVRSEHEKTMVAYVKHNYDQLAKMAVAERDGLIEEATQTSIEIGSEIAEHMAEVFPIVGGIMASSAAGARGAMQLYKIGSLIKNLANLNIDHVEIPALSQETVSMMVKGHDFTQDEVLLKAVTSKLSNVEEIKTEVTHLENDVIDKIKKQAFEDSFNSGGTGIGIPHITKTGMQLPKALQPGIHVYTSSWDSDYIVIFHVVGPYSKRSSFLFCVDFLLDFVGLYDVHVMHHQVCALMVLSQVTIHCKLPWTISLLNYRLMAWGTRNIWREWPEVRASARCMWGTFPTGVSYTRIRDNAETIMRDPDLQLHLLRGPLAMQRRNFLNALLHGMIVLDAVPARLMY